MTHIRGVTLRKRDRLPLHELAPLTHPMVLYLEPTNVCNFACDMCPTGDRNLIRRVGRPVGSMPWELWKKVIDDLAQFEKPAENAHLFKDGETTLHPKFLDMLGYLRDKHVANKLWIKTNGSRLSPEFNEGMIANGMDNIGISVEHVNAEGYMKRSHVKFDYEKLRENVADLYGRRRECKIYVKIPSQGLTEEEIAKFYADFDDRCDYIGLENYHGWSAPELKDFTMGYTSDTYDGNPLMDKIVCPWIVFSLTVNWNGATSICPEDWAWKTIIGDASKEHLIDIWNGDQMFQFRKMHLEARRADNIACRNCYFMRTLPDNVDEHRLQMLEKYEAKIRKSEVP